MFRLTSQGIEGMEACSYPIQLKTGTLTVRGTTEEPASTEIVSEESEVYGNEVTAMAPADVTYYVNDSQVEITDKENVKLLVDDVLDTQVLTDYIAEHVRTFQPERTCLPFSTWTWWTPATATPWSPWGKGRK